MARQMRTPRKTKHWQAIPSINLDLTADATVLGGSVAVAQDSETVMRMLGEYIIAPTTSPVAQDEAFVTMAIGVVSTDAFAAGAASVPDPSPEPEYQWLYWADHPFFYNSTTIDGATAEAAGTIRVSFDVKTRRIIRPRQSLCWIVQYTDLAGTPPLTVGIGTTRVLFAHG